METHLKHNNIQQTDDTEHEMQETTNQTASFPSPAHEFSFNIISLQSSSSSSTPSANSNHPSSAIDLSPADDIFFHGHLLPLHLLPVISPRSSTTSIDDSTIPIRHLTADQPKQSITNNNNNNNTINGCICNRCDTDNNNNNPRGHSFNSYEYAARRLQEPSNPRIKAKSFSLFGNARRRKESEEDDVVNKKKAGFDMTHFLKKYVKLFSKGRTEDIHFRQQPYSFSGKLSPRSQECNADFRGEFSAPASMRTSPANSGVISGTKRVNFPHSNNNDSTMEELQAAIQAAITHCKDSIAGPPQKLQS